MTTAAVNYLQRDASLPDMGSSGLGPRTMTARDVEAVMACDDVAALGQMSAYSRSYFATAGGIVFGAVGAVAGILIGRRHLAVVSAALAGASTLVTIEARRRARQWDAVVQARLTALALNHD